jgi:hypothetical protein
MSAKRFTFTIGLAGAGDDSYEVANAPADWLLIGGLAMCVVCGQVLRLVFDSPPKTGTALCGCAPLNNREFKTLPG